MGDTVKLAYGFAVGELVERSMCTDLAGAAPSDRGTVTVSDGSGPIAFRH
ncbi:hypothetical protein [Nocardia brasiliensis]